MGLETDLMIWDFVCLPFSHSIEISSTLSLTLFDSFFRNCVPAGLQFRNCRTRSLQKIVSEEFTYRYALWGDWMEKSTFFQWWVATIRKAERYSDSQGLKAVCVWRGRHQIPWLFQWSRPCWTLSSSSKPQFIDPLIAYKLFEVTPLATNLVRNICLTLLYIWLQVKIINQNVVPFPGICSYVTVVWLLWASMLIFSGGLLWGSLLMGCWRFIECLLEDNWEFLRLIESLMRLFGYSTWHLNNARLWAKII